MARLPTRIAKDTLMISVDFSKPYTSKRMCITLRNEDGTPGESVLCVEVAQGSGEGFSNRPDSHCSSLGTFELLNVYVGKHGKSIRLKGLDKTNDKAYERYIVIHEAPYIGNGRTGKSWGCFAIPPGTIRYFLPLADKGILLVAKD